TVRFRHYDPEIGRWLERGPAGYVDGLSLLHYASDAPVDTSDPMGLGPEDWYEPSQGGGGSSSPEDWNEYQRKINEARAACECENALQDWKDICDRVRQKLSNIRQKLQERRGQLHENLGPKRDRVPLPETVPGDWKTPSISKRGHRALIEQTIDYIKDLEKFLELWCNSPKMPPGFSPRFVPRERPFAYYYDRYRYVFPSIPSPEPVRTPTPSIDPVRPVRPPTPVVDPVRPVYTPIEWFPIEFDSPEAARNAGWLIGAGLGAAAIEYMRRCPNMRPAH
ncbi:MAG: hypothetical protein KF869_10260, partial [Phycisphaeraceae bacterium]|nr:hypothetical protein [Phycisphaeraceae bacterium]